MFDPIIIPITAFTSFALGFALRCVIGYLLQNKCAHKNKSTFSISASVNCEETTVYCRDCFEILEKPKTDCR